MSAIKIAFVTPWYGQDIPGGAEAEVRRTAEHLHRAGMQVEVLTTCVRDFRSDWSVNHHRPGISVENGVQVRRFPVRRRDREAFDAVNYRLMQGLPVTPAEEQLFVAENVRSLALESYIAEHSQEYFYFFIPYMFGTTYWGIQAAGDHAFIVPCLHDESYAHMSVFREMFARVQRVVLLSDPERRLARSLYGLSESTLVLVGGGVDTDWDSHPWSLREKYRLERPFVLYAGRKDPGKNVDLLIRYYRRYRSSHPDGPDLVLIGGGALPAAVSGDEGIRDLGFVPAQDKYNAYAAAVCLCQPSLQESFSLVVMESWVAEVPVLVHADCAVTREHCVRSNGGLFFSTYREFEACLDVLLTRPLLREALGRNGRRHVLENYHWDAVVDRFRQLVDDYCATDEADPL
ncbi:MAG: glycosyltransferase family 4 protein [Anaerolineae bacterium]|nr:glycosyltransferase family 4 protein [Anaerolineae bacterium]